MPMDALSLQLERVSLGVSPLSAEERARRIRYALITIAVNTLHRRVLLGFLAKHDNNERASALMIVAYNRALEQLRVLNELTSLGGHEEDYKALVRNLTTTSIVKSTLGGLKHHDEGFLEGVQMVVEVYEQWVENHLHFQRTRLMHPKEPIES
ncbi:hypothetical protein BDZ89DRAFT_1043451 [Hymenopellis radicata]|nr:hypothetical protein BDZ89DRAFT_1043451 [Hymenopellis radicata]